MRSSLTSPRTSCVKSWHAGTHAAVIVWKRGGEHVRVPLQDDVAHIDADLGFWELPSIAPWMTHSLSECDSCR